MNTIGNRADIFAILEEQDRMIIANLKSFAENYLSFSNDSALKKIKEIFDMISAHFKQLDQLIACVEKDSELEAAVEEYKREKRLINDQILHLTQLHVDETGFRRYIKELADYIRELALLESTSLHEKLEDRLTTSQLEMINRKISQETTFGRRF